MSSILSKWYYEHRKTPKMSLAQYSLTSGMASNTNHSFIHWKTVIRNQTPDSWSWVQYPFNSRCCFTKFRSSFLSKNYTILGAPASELPYEMGPWTLYNVTPIPWWKHPPNHAAIFRHRLCSFILQRSHQWLWLHDNTGDYKSFSLISYSPWNYWLKRYNPESYFLSGVKFQTYVPELDPVTSLEAKGSNCVSW